MAVHSQPLNDSCSNSSDLLFTGLDLLFELKPLFIPLYALLVTVACTGNLLLLCLISFTKKLQNTTDFLIGNLAAADLIMCIFCVPLTAVYAFESRGWLFGVFMCYFVTLMQGTTVFVSVLSLTAIAIDRYIVIVHPIRQRKRKIPRAVCQNQEKWTTKKEKTFQILVVSILCFGLCWLPLQVG
ncbi:prolactin-releasing peptide receptor-like [Crotalus adamanteus]|uniref:Prolactin-releasing peptide receptor-like n=1 Tax=Crotalus adamanteus TaxID=8729 RepID=A0AAW1C547_CROAD